MDLAQRSKPSCPKCGRPVTPGATECSACGVVLSKVHAPGSRPPAAEVSAGAWRAGPLLVMRRGARLPDRCVRCGAPGEGGVQKALVWHAPALYLLLGLHVLVYLPIALLVLKRVEVDLPLCRRHRRGRRARIAIGWALIAVALGLFASVLFLRGHPSLLLVSVAVAFVGIVTAGRAVQIALARRIDDEHLWIEKLGPGFLARLPEAPEALRQP